MNEAPALDRTAAARLIDVHGVVQGVGFRPFVWRLATRHGLAGWVRNRSGTVEILAEGPRPSLEAFCRALETDAPPLARVELIGWADRPVAGLATFEVEGSLGGDETERLVPSDVATCPTCLREILDPADRRFGYPFTNCTDCGPRLTIMESFPYDRERTSMKAFPLCDECAREYADPADRRFHAEPVACPACGPQLLLMDARWHAVDGDPVARAVERLAAGAVVAVKGLGGFQLACDATDHAAVSKLRQRKGRPDKPFAVMVADIESARDLFEPTAAEEELLRSWRAPIVLIRDRGLLATSVAPGHRRQGVMLPTTPLHHLLLRAFGRPLVMTSGNRTDEPICITNVEARQRLKGIADAFLVHERDVMVRCDDSVAQVRGKRPMILRRARGYVPGAVALPAHCEPLLGAGAELHGAFCLATGERAYLSQHLGTLDTDEAMSAYEAALERHQALFAIEPEAVAHDLHPDFLTTRFAQATGLPALAVQHHHAHVAAVMAEHRLEGPVLGVAFDGFGLGDDGTAWGGEFLVVDRAGARRVGHLRQVRQPGGDAAVRDPVRMALAHATDAGVLEAAVPLLAGGHREASGIRGPRALRAEAEVILAQLSSGLGSPFTSSAGRLFDAVAALTGICRRTTYEGQPAILLEQAAEGSATFEYPFDLDQQDGRLVIDTRPVIAAVVHDLMKGRAPGDVAGRFHRTLAAAALMVCRIAGLETGIRRVCLAGGVFANNLLASDLAARLAACNFEVFVPWRVPVGDGGIALGQVLVAHARLSGTG